ncbi:MFS transporter, OFA family, oxalate/formate antiporter [Desulfocicer vacuolatum DSM 3385]|uniref:MFS transporter, OFA family, oxalate/formate antiporter n=1 Tax=Desulfocicer vacuolatum DSM 3385 TaxID=1121400 RepID=A0A1W2DGR3_9BACT|nr:OFA family MFS transporter [Desulfocicer vacuolatum]SMC96693.1 MFS transporter, OFA family, oxalate/formate antiporter [Desulfocicer vacuolatum DSM 3385]
MSSIGTKEPLNAWITVFAGTAINLCLGILYAWSIWSSALIDTERAGQSMTGPNSGWEYITNTQAAIPFSICVIVFALLMIPGGRIQDRFGPKTGAILGGLFLAAGCILAGLMKSFTGLVIGFGFLGGIGMGIGYAAPTPAAMKWFGPHKRGLIAGLVVSGYGGAALYIAPFGQYLMNNYGITGSFVGLGIWFAVIVCIAGQLLVNPPSGYKAPGKAHASPEQKTAITSKEWAPAQTLRCWQLYSLIFMFMLSTQSGLLIISNANGLLKTVGKDIPFFAANAWILVAYGGLINASGRIATGLYSDKIGRLNAYCINMGVSALCLFLLPFIIKTQNVFLLFLAVGIAFWQYGGGLSLLPAFTADFFGSKNLGFNYGIVFLGWGVGMFIPQLAGIIKDYTGNLNYAFYLSGTLLLVGIAIARLTTKPNFEQFSVGENASITSH